MKSKPKIEALHKVYLFERKTTFKFLVEQVEAYIEADIEMELLRKSYPDPLAIFCGLVILFTTILLVFLPPPDRLLLIAFISLWLICGIAITKKRATIEKCKLSIQAKRLCIAESIRNTISEIEFSTLEEEALVDQNSDCKVIHLFFQTVREILKIEPENFKIDSTKRLREFLSTE